MKSINEIFKTSDLNSTEQLYNTKKNSIEDLEKLIDD